MLLGTDRSADHMPAMRALSFEQVLSITETRRKLFHRNGMDDAENAPLAGTQFHIPGKRNPFGIINGRLAGLMTMRARVFHAIPLHRHFLAGYQNGIEQDEPEGTNQQHRQGKQSDQEGILPIDRDDGQADLENVEDLEDFTSPVDGILAELIEGFPPVDGIDGQIEQRDGEDGGQQLDPELLLGEHVEAQIDGPAEPQDNQGPYEDPGQDIGRPSHTEHEPAYQDNRSEGRHKSERDPQDDLQTAQIRLRVVEQDLFHSVISD